MFFIISYDTPSDKRRRKIAKALEGYATRVQKSVFETNLDAKKKEELKKKLTEIINEKEDNLRLYEIPKDYIPKISVWGQIPLVEEKNFYFITSGNEFEEGAEDDIEVIEID